MARVMLRRCARGEPRMNDAQAHAAVFEWQEGSKRMSLIPSGRRAACEAVVDAVQIELRRRLGTSFTVGELAREYADAHMWFLPIAVEVAPRFPEAHDGAVTLDAAFARFMRRAMDASLW